MSLHDQLIFGIRRIFSAGVELVNRSALEFVGATVEDDPVNKRTKVTIAIPGLPAPIANRLLQGNGTEWEAVAGIDAARITTGGLPAIRGGTGYSGYNVGDVLFASSPVSLGTRAIGAEGSLFVVSGGLPAWVSGISTDRLNAGTLGYARGGTGQSSWTKGDLLYASAANTLAKLSAGNAGTVLMSDAGLPSWSRLAELYDGSNDVRFPLVSMDFHEWPDSSDRIAVTIDGGFAVKMTNRTGAASIKGSVLQLDRTWYVTSTSQLSGLTLKGHTMAYTDAGRVYLQVINQNPDVTVWVWADSARTVKVAAGTLVGGWAAGGLVTLTEMGGSGVTGSVTVVASPASENTGVATLGSTNGVILPAGVDSGVLPPPLVGVMYSDAVPDGSDAWVVVAGKAYVLTCAGAAASGHLYLANRAAPDNAKCECEILRTTNYATYGVGMALERVTSGLVLAKLDLRGYGTVLGA